MVGIVPTVAQCAGRPPWRNPGCRRNPSPLSMQGEFSALRAALRAAWRRRPAAPACRAGLSGGLSGGLAGGLAGGVAGGLAGGVAGGLARRPAAPACRYLGRAVPRPLFSRCKSLICNKKSPGADRAFLIPAC